MAARAVGLVQAVTASEEPFAALRALRDIALVQEQLRELRGAVIPAAEQVAKCLKKLVHLAIDTSLDGDLTLPQARLDDSHVQYAKDKLEKCRLDKKEAEKVTAAEERVAGEQAVTAVEEEVAQEVAAPIAAAKGLWQKGVDMFEKVLGFDLDGDGTIGGSLPVPAPAPAEAGASTTAALDLAAVKEAAAIRLAAWAPRCQG